MTENLGKKTGTQIIMSRPPETQALVDSPPSYLIYDQNCRLCVSITDRLSTMAEEQNLRWVPYSSDEAKALLGASFIPGRPSLAYLIDAEGQVHQGLDAFIPMFLQGRWRPWVSRLWRFRWVRVSGYAAYRVIAKHRYAWFGPVQ